MWCNWYDKSGVRIYLSDMKIKLNELRKFIQGQLLLEYEAGIESRNVSPLSNKVVVNIFQEFKIDSGVVAKYKQTVSDAFSFDEMIKRVTDGLNDVGKAYATSDRLMSDKKSLELVKNVLTDPANYSLGAERNVPEFIMRDLERLVFKVADAMEVTILARGGAAMNDDEKIVINIMTSIHGLFTGRNGINVLGDLLYAYDMKPEAQVANNAMGALTTLSKTLEQNKKDGKFKEFTDVFSKGSPTSGPRIASDQMKTKIN